MYAGSDFAEAKPGSLHIDFTSANRTVCRLEFAKIENLVVDATYVGAKKQRSRVNIERYSACPYDVAIKYAGLKMRVDFGTAIKLNNIRNYDPALPVDMGYFVYEGDAWQAGSDVLPDADTKIKVQSNQQYELVTGTVHRKDPNSKLEHYCFAIAMIETNGYAIGGVCANKKTDLLPLSDLFGKSPLILRYSEARPMP